MHKNILVLTTHL
jgi:hypothetical protein